MLTQNTQGKHLGHIVAQNYYLYIQGLNSINNMISMLSQFWIDTEIFYLLKRGPVVNCLKKTRYVALSSLTGKKWGNNPL